VPEKICVSKANGAKLWLAASVLASLVFPELTQHVRCLASPVRSSKLVVGATVGLSLSSLFLKCQSMLDYGCGSLLQKLYEGLSMCVREVLSLQKIGNGLLLWLASSVLPGINFNGCAGMPGLACPFFQNIQSASPWSPSFMRFEHVAKMGLVLSFPKSTFIDGYFLLAF
jgi:hypothetical protein